MFVLVETNPDTKQSERFTFRNFEELHAWVAARARAQPTLANITTPRDVIITGTKVSIPILSQDI
jgi:hypothetical protein